MYIDETGTKGTTTVKYPVGTTYAVIDAEASVLASLIAPITGCVLVRQRIIYKAVEIPRLSPDTGSDVKQAAVFFFATEANAIDGLLAVPGILEGVMRIDEPFAGYVVDGSNSAIVSLVAVILAAGLTNPFGDVFTSLVTAYRQSRS